MKKTLALLMALLMMLPICVIPATAETAPVPTAAATLDEALNKEGGILHFEPIGDHTFVIDDDCAKSNNQNVSNSAAAVLVQGIDTTVEKVLHLKYKVSSESNWDKFQIYIDGASVFNDSGDKSSTWLNADIIIPAGTEEIKLAYTKDGSGDRFSDTVWIDDVYASEYVSVSGVQFNQDSISLDINASQHLDWTVLPEDSANKAVSFASSDTSIVTVTGAGVASGVGEGDAVITITTAEGEFTDTIDVHVNPPIPVTEVILTPDEITIPVIDSYYFQLTAEVLPENATFSTVTWSSSDPTILAVSSAGMLKGVAPGTAEAIAITPEGIEGRCTVTVLSQEDYPGVLDLSFTEINALPYADTDIALGNGDGELILFKKTASASPIVAYAVGYSFTAAAGQQVCFRSDWPNDEHNDSEKLDTYMVLVDSEGNILAYNDDDPNNRPYSMITHSFNDSGVYYIAIIPYFNTKSGIIRFYAEDATPEETPIPSNEPITPTQEPITSAPNSAVFTYNDIEARAGETFSVTVMLNNYHNDCNYLDMDITYDPSILTYISHTGGTFYTEAYSASIIPEAPGSISANFYGGDDEWSGEELPIYVIGPCSIVTITFRVNDDASGTTSLGFDVNWYEDGDEEPLEYSVLPGSISILNSSTPAPETPEPVQGITWDFESDPFADGWTAVDANDDTYSWEWKYGISALPAHGGSGIVASFSCINGIVGDISPDNWLISPSFIAGNSLSFFMRGLDYTYYMDPVGIYITTDGGQTWSDEIAYFVCEPYYVQQTIDLSAYAGQAVQLAFRHYNVFGQYAIGIDDVTAIGACEAPETPTPVLPTPQPAGSLDDALNIEGGTLHFEPEGNYTFIVEESWAKSNNQGIDSSEAIIQVQNYDFSMGAVLRFKYKVSSERTYDKLQVKADNNLLFQESGAQAEDWISGSVVIPAGTQIVRFVYRKDISGANGDDTAWLDDIEIGELIPVTGVEFTQDAISLPLARTCQLEWNILPANADITDVEFTVDAPDIISVSFDGVVTGLSSGDAVVTITTADGGFTDTINIHVEDEIAVESIIIAPAELIIPITSSVTEQLTANILPENATDTSVTWASSNETVCTVNAGKLRGLSAGVAEITATSANGVVGTCTVTVVPAEEFPGIFDLEYTALDPLPYFNGEVGIGIGYGTPIYYQRSTYSGSMTYTYAVGYSYNAEGGETIRFRTNWYNDENTDENRVDTYLTLFNSAGEILAYNDDASGNSPFSTLEYTFTEAGTYYFIVAPYNFQSAAGHGLIQIIAEDISPEIIPGDIDGDGSVNMADAVLAARHVMGLITLNDEQLLAANVNDDAIINFNDVVLILRMAAEYNP